jgi:hypothetical protein
VESKKDIRNPILALVFLSLGGWLLHARVHPVSFDPASPSNPAFFVPFVWGLVNIVVTPLLLSLRKTVIIGYVANGIAVIVGTLTMATISLNHPPEPLTIGSIFLGTMLGSILLLFPKLFIGQIVLLHYFPNGLGRMFTASWWVRHFFYLGIVYAFGHFLWR